MYCNNCGKHIPEESKFCQYCGFHIILADSVEKSIEHGNEDQEEVTPQKKQTDTLWEKFVEVYDAKDDERRKFYALSSAYIWEFLERIGLNSFESFIQENKEDLNKRPYKVIEALKSIYIGVVIGGYKLWLAEALLDDKEELNKFKSFSLNKLIDVWREYDFDKAYRAISEQVGVCITKYEEFSFNNFMNNVPEANELLNATAENLKSSLLVQIVMGYNAGKIENGFRKK